jgi:hypothetical protein
VQNDQNTAVRHHQTGELAQASRLYQGILARHADYPKIGAMLESAGN